MDTTDSKGVAPPPPRQAAATPVSAAMSALDLAAVAGAAANTGDESKVYINYNRGSAMRGKTLIQSTTNFQQSGTKGKENANPMSPSSSSSSDSYGMAFSPLSSSQVQNFALPPPSTVDLHMQGKC